MKKFVAVVRTCMNCPHSDWYAPKNGGSLWKGTFECDHPAHGFKGNLRLNARDAKKGIHPACPLSDVKRPSRRRIIVELYSQAPDEWYFYVPGPGVRIESERSYLRKKGKRNATRAAISLSKETGWPVFNEEGKQLWPKKVKRED